MNKFFSPQRNDDAIKLGRWHFMAPELAQLLYALFTVVIILFTWTNHADAAQLLWQRLTFLSGTLGLWIVYRLWPCRAIVFCRVVYLLVVLGSWYPDTYELNKQFVNLDPMVAAWDHDLFGMQPALWFSRIFSGALVSELMYMGYFSYYLFFVVTTVYLFFRDYKQLERVCLIIFGGFFVCYVVYCLMPVTGPQYYFPAVGLEVIERGEYPEVGDYFLTHSDAIKMPGWDGGLFYSLCHMMHQAGERPTAAFPSSHVAIATVVMLIVGKMRMWRYLLFLSVPYIFLCMATVYIMAHYAIDALCGLAFGGLLFIAFGGMKLRKAAA